MKADRREALKTYANYSRYAVKYNLKSNTFGCQFASKGFFIEEAAVTGLYDENNIKLSSIEEYKEVETTWEQKNYSADTRLSIFYSGGPDFYKNFDILFVVDRNGIHCSVNCEEGVTPHIRGKFKWGTDMENSTFAMCLNRQGMDLRSAFGPAASTADNALFDRNSDSAVEITDTDQFLLCYDWNEHLYRFDINAKQFSISVHENVFEHIFKTPYKPINKGNTFPKPPVGWMTWYAVMFDACEKAVLDNARWLKENLSEYGADTIWVDWEWYHSAFDHAGPEGIDYFNPDSTRYPNGLGYVSEEIKKLGFVPALWIGPTNEPTLTDFIKNNKDTILARKISWCGEYFFDITHPKFTDEYLPKAIKALLGWGYKALKWDCLPITLAYADQYHEYMVNPEMTSEEALRKVIKKVREVAGDDFYMLSCAGAADREVNMAIDIFDAARIGGDIFGWQEFIRDFVARVMKFYSYHNTEIYCDPDNLVIRPEFNTFDQAVSRVSFLSVLGLPITLGDNLPDLPEERVELLRRCIPALDIHPMDIREVDHDYHYVITNLAINRPFEQWNVVNILNLLESDNEISIDIKNELHLPAQDYLVYDYWNHSFLGKYSDKIILNLCPCSSLIISVRKAADHPQIVTTSRHISQGAVDLIDVCWDEADGVLSGISKVVKGDPYEIIVHEPSGKLTERKIIPDETGEYKWSFSF